MPVPANVLGSVTHTAARNSIQLSMLRQTMRTWCFEQPLGLAARYVALMTLDDNAKHGVPARIAFAPNTKDFLTRGTGNALSYPNPQRRARALAHALWVRHPADLRLACRTRKSEHPCTADQIRSHANIGLARSRATRVFRTQRICTGNALAFGDTDGARLFLASVDRVLSGRRDRKLQ